VTSLRWRLAAGAALVAIVPLALGLYVQSRRVDRTLRTQADTRLDASLASLAARLDGDGTRMAAQLALLGADPELRRLVVLRPGTERDLADYLAAHRVLLALDYLSVADPGGGVFADAADAGGAAPADDDAWRDVAARRAAAERPALDSLGAAQAMVVAASAPIVYQGARAGAIVGGLRVDRVTLAALRQTSGIELALVDAAGATRAATADAAVASQSRAYRCRSTAIGATGARIVGCVSTAASDQASAALRTASVTLAAAGLLLALVLGLLWSWRVARPVERLAADSRRLARGDWDTPVEPSGIRELEALAGSLDHMRQDLREYRERLRVSERHAAWSQMARTVAHEVKNPLTPIAIAVADLKRSHELNRPEFPQILEQAVRIVGEEVESLKRLLDEFSEFARLPAPRFERCRIAELLGGLATLHARDVEQGRLSIAPADPDVTIEADPDQLRRALVNLIKNGLEASGVDGRVTVAAAADAEALEIVVNDAGPGLDDEQRANLFVPGYSTKGRERGIGLTVVERIVNDHGGAIAVDSAPGRGTTFRVRLPRSQPRAAGDERS
jgi:signal transduction histidine kinase